MKNFPAFFLLILAATSVLHAQPSFSATTVPSRDLVADAAARRAAYLKRVQEVIDYRANLVNRADPGGIDLAAVATMLARHDDPKFCSEQVIRLMKAPGTGPFWMFPVVCVTYMGRDQLSPEAKQAMRDMWRTTYQIRGDTENHWAMYYISLYLISEMYPNEPASSWFNGKSSEENLAESREYLIHWMDLATTIGQGEYNPVHYIGEYACPLIYLASWAKDPAMKTRGHMMLEWIFADLAGASLYGVPVGPHSRSTDEALIEPSNSLASYFSWLLFGNVPPPAGFGGWGIYFAPAAANYEVPEVLYRIAMDRQHDFLQKDLKRTRRRWRYSDQLSPPIYKTTYVRHDYAVASYQGGLSDPIQTHVWDVTWAVPNPRGQHNLMFSMHPESDPHSMQMYFTDYPDTTVGGAVNLSKPSYDSPDKLLGGSPYEQVFQDLDTIVALYVLPPTTKFPHINGFFSKDLTKFTEDKSGWIFAQGGNAYLAYRPLAPYVWTQSHWAQAAIRDSRLQSDSLKNGTIVQAASTGEFKDIEAFKAAINALPLEFSLEPVPTVKLRTLRGKNIVVTYGAAPVVDGRPLDYTKWKLFEGPYLNAEKGSRKLTMTYGKLQRVLDFNTVTITDSVLP
jgi:hypothetical protein